MTSRLKRFNKELSEFRSDHDYKKIQDLYTKNQDFSIATARKLFKSVKYTKAGNVFKASVPKKLERDKFIFQYDFKIKPKENLETMNKRFKNAINKSALDQINHLSVLNNLDTSNKYIINVEKVGERGQKQNRIFTLNKTILKSIFDKGFTYTETGGKNESDAWIAEYREDITKFEINKLDYQADPFIDDEPQKKHRKMNRNIGRFNSYNTHNGVDLSEFQIYKENDNIDNTNCLLYTLTKAGIDETTIKNLIVKFSEVSGKTDICVKTFDYIKCSEFQNVSDAIGKNIKISHYNTVQKIHKLYKTKDATETIELAIFNNHIFINKPTIYKTYSILNYENLKHKKDWFVYSGYKNKAGGKLLSSLEVVKLLDEKGYFKPIPLSVDITDNVSKLTTNDLLEKLNDNQQEFQYKPKVSKDEIYFFADLENINNTNSNSQAFLAGIIQENETEPAIFTGLDCVNQMFKHVQKYIKENGINRSTGVVIYFHNMKYDFSLMKSSDIYIISICQKDNAIYNVKLKYYDMEIELRDSYKLFSEKLEKFPKAFNLSPELCKQEAIGYDYYTIKTISEPHASIKVYSHYIKESQKELFLENIKPFICHDDNKKFDHMEYYRYYLKFDCLVLQQGMKTFNKIIQSTFKYNIYDFLTISSFADEYFKARGVYDGVYECTGGFRKFLSKAVYGGRVNACKEFKQQVINKKINDFDGVSLYPSAIYRLCQEYGIAKGPAKRLQNESITDKDYYVVDILITKINKKQQNPFIAYQTDASIKYINELPDDKPITVSVDRFTLEDYIKFHQIEYKVLDGVYYDNGFNNNFICIKDVFDERLKQKSLKTPQGDILQGIYKLILNSAYGKTLLKTSCEKQNVVYAKSFNAYLINNFNTIKHAVKLTDKQYLVTQIEADKSFNRAVAGIAILSISKRIMNEVMSTASDNNINIYYQDTDSMHIDDDQIEKLAELFEAKYNRKLIGKSLSQFHNDFSHKNGKAKDVVAIKSIFLGKKAYLDVLEGTLPDGSKSYCYHARLKGVNETALLNQAAMNDGPTLEDKVFKVYQDLAEGKTIEFILNPDDKPAFVFTSTGVHKRQSNTFKRNVSFTSGELEEVSDDETL